MARIVILLGVVAAGILLWWLYTRPVAVTETNSGANPATTTETNKFRSSTPTPADDDISCIQVITPARNPKTGEVKEFPTPCDVPEGWETVDGSTQ